MIRQIISKEILENLLSFRFILSLVLIILLFAVSGFVFVGKYEQQSSDYWEKTNENLEGLSKQSQQLYRSLFASMDLRNLCLTAIRLTFSAVTCPK